MTDFQYDKKSVESIFEHSLKLVGHSLSEVTQLPENITNTKNRGDLGSLVEKYFFNHKPESNHGPDFADAGLELKTTGVIKNKDGKFRAKERLVLTMIDYEKIINEKWEKSSLVNKCKLMLILFYNYSKEIPVEQRKFVLNPMLLDLTTSDIAIIRSDWEKIQKKIKDGKAHELSEGDTFYLGACRKGAGGINEKMRTQPNSSLKAKSRAFSFKPNYINQLIDGNLKNSNVLNVDSKRTIEKATQLKFEPFIGMKIEQIIRELKLEKKFGKSKQLLRLLSIHILGNGNEFIPELEKAGVEIKTINLNKYGKAKESMSFPGFKFMEIINEEWEDSSFYEKIERKFLFIIFKDDSDGNKILHKAAYWNMPYEDRKEAQRVWEDTKKRVKYDASDLPKISESKIAHVRPKGRDGQDKIITPQGNKILKQSFWLNATYITKVVSNL